MVNESSMPGRVLTLQLKKKIHKESLHFQNSHLDHEKSTEALKPNRVLTL